MCRPRRPLAPQGQLSLTPSAVQSLAACVPHLQRLCLWMPHALADDHLRALLRPLAGLRHLAVAQLDLR